VAQVKALGSAVHARDDARVAYWCKGIRLNELFQELATSLRIGRDRALAMQAGLQVEGQRIVAGLEQSHQAELARRQAALNAMAQWAQTQQVISAMNRPVTTNCMNLGSGIVNCVSR
jgi:hypothetical protein